MQTNNPTMNELRDASPSILDQQKSDTAKAVKVLQSKSEDTESNWDKELLTAAAQYLKNEVMNQ